MDWRCTFSAWAIWSAIAFLLLRPGQCSLTPYPLRHSLDLGGGSTWTSLLQGIPVFCLGWRIGPWQRSCTAGYCSVTGRCTYGSVSNSSASHSSNEWQVDCVYLASSSRLPWPSKRGGFICLYGCLISSKGAVVFHWILPLPQSMRLPLHVP